MLGSFCAWRVCNCRTWCQLLDVAPVAGVTGLSNMSRGLMCFVSCAWLSCLSAAEDAAVLGWHVQQAGLTAAALRAFEAERIPRVKEVFGIGDRHAAKMKAGAYVWAWMSLRSRSCCSQCCTPLSCRMVFVWPKARTAADSPAWFATCLCVCTARRHPSTRAATGACRAAVRQGEIQATGDEADRRRQDGCDGSAGWCSISLIEVVAAHVLY